MIETEWVWVSGVVSVSLAWTAPAEVVPFTEEIEEVDELLTAGVLVDLYATVRASLRTGQSSYSLKKLEPLYMDVARESDVAGHLAVWAFEVSGFVEYRRWPPAGVADAGQVVAAGRLPRDGQGAGTSHEERLDLELARAVERDEYFAGSTRPIAAAASIGD